MKGAGLPVELVINPGCAHEAPADFGERLQRALDYVHSA